MRKLIYIIFVITFLTVLAVTTVTAQNRVNQNGLVGNPDNTNFTKKEIIQAFENKGFVLTVDTKKKDIIVKNENGTINTWIRNDYTYNQLMAYKIEGSKFNNRSEYIIYWLAGIVEILCLNEYC